MKEAGGWFLPSKDSYFGKFVDGPAPKANGFQREHLLAAFKHVQKWRMAVDVGAHVGFWARDMAQRFEHVYCFEPAEDCFECLDRNLADFSNAVLMNCAVGDKAGQCTLLDDPDRIHKGGANTGARFVSPGGGPIRMIALDQLNLQACDFLKIDVEGFELQVLHGAVQTIKRCRPVVIMECDKKFSKPRYGVATIRAELFLVAQGYTMAGHMRPDKIFVPQL